MISFNDFQRFQPCGTGQRIPAKGSSVSACRPLIHNFFFCNDRCQRDASPQSLGRCQNVRFHAKPKIANYHFTTLVPTLGVVSVGEGASFVCADIPGLIEGASEGIGLGHDFLRHVERCRLLLHVVDVSGSECREPIEDFEKINEELAKFSPVLAERPQIVIGNKCDLATEEQIEAFRKYVEGKGLTFVPISAATMQGVKELPGLVYNRLKDIPPVPVFAPEYKKPEPKANDRAFEIKRMEAHVWSVEAPWLEYILAGSNVDDYESLQFFQRQLGESGILDALVAKGVQENDTILIGDYQFDYIF